MMKGSKRMKTSGQLFVGYLFMDIQKGKDPMPMDILPFKGFEDDS